MHMDTYIYIYNMDGWRSLSMMNFGQMTQVFQETSKTKMPTLCVRSGPPTWCSPLPEPCQETSKGKNKKALNSTDPGMQGLALAEGSDSV